LEISDHGGHCGFIRDWQQHGFAEHWLKTGLIAALDGVQ
jgi:predicted alpha/beta-fold hydrolase